MYIIYCKNINRVFFGLILIDRIFCLLRLNLELILNKVLKKNWLME